MIVNEIHSQIINLPPPTVEEVTIEETQVIPISLQPIESETREIHPGRSSTPEAEKERKERISEQVNFHLNEDQTFNAFLDEIFENAKEGN